MLKKSVIKTILTINLIFFASLLLCQTINIPENFVEANIPIVESHEWFKLNHSKDYYAVKKVNNELLIEQTELKDKVEYLTKKGKLIGYDEGEFGGRLNYIPNSEPSKTIEIMFGNIVDIFDFKNKIYILQGGYKGGSISELKINYENFDVKRLFNFDNPPLAVEVFENKIFVVSFNGFYIVENNDWEKIFYNQFWWGLYPSSIAYFDDENIFLGIRSGIVKLDIKNKTVKFYQETKK